MPEIRIGSLTILERPREYEASGMFLKPGGMQGWEGLPASRREALARAVSHGEHDVPTYLPARVVTYDWWCVSESEFAAFNDSNRINGIGGTGQPVQVVVEHHGVPLYASGRRIIASAVDTGMRESGRPILECQLQLVFANPRKYGKTNTFPEAGTVTSMDVLHRGNFPAHPVIEIPSAPTSYTITSPAGTFSVTGATAGGTHRVDMRTGRVTRNGVWMRGIGAGPLWAVPEGQVWAHTLSVPGRVLIADTYI